MQNCSVQSGTTLPVHWSLLQWSILMEMRNLEHNVIMCRLILYVKASLQSALHARRWFKSKKHETEVSLAWLRTNISTGRRKSTHPPSKSSESGAEGRMGGGGEGDVHTRSDADSSSSSSVACSLCPLQTKDTAAPLGLSLPHLLNLVNNDVVWILHFFKGQISFYEGHMHKDYRDGPATCPAAQRMTQTGDLSVFWLGFFF